MKITRKKLGSWLRAMIFSLSMTALMGGLGWIASKLFGISWAGVFVGGYIVAMFRIAMFDRTTEDDDDDDWITISVSEHWGRK